MEKIKLNEWLEQSFQAVMPPVVLFLLDMLSHLHPELKMKELQTEVVKEGTSVAVICNSVESVMVRLSPEHQEEVQNLAKAFGEKLLEAIDSMIWEPKFEGGELVGFKRKIRRRPRI